ncbi:amidohydrolase family protein [Rhodohalobacter sp. 8-1]|uniref:amidohydrolase family protein n=1 Tax=Rhodohalobacter sp. 8-1 TaxID=3131972 RepID=UPI0030EF261A
MNHANSISAVHTDQSVRLVPMLIAGTLLTFITVLIMTVSANAQTPAPPQSQPIALTGGTIYTVSNGVIENGTIVFEDGVITAIGQNVQIPMGAERVDVSGKEIYPGMIDAYTRMGIFEIGAVGMTVDINETGDFNPNVTPEIAFNPESRHIGTARTNGVLTAITTPGGGIISGQSSTMMLDGWSWADMVLDSRTGMMINWPSADDDDYGDELLALHDFVAEAKAYHKAKQAFINGNAPRLENDSRLEAMGALISGEQPVVVEADEMREIQDAITWAEDQNFRIIIMGGRDAHYISEFLVEKNVPVIITEVLDAPDRDWEAYDDQYRLPAKLEAAGVTYAIAGGSSAPYTFRLANDAGASVAFGLTFDEAFRAVSLTPAQILGIDNRVGSLETGKDATLLITTGNPVEYSTQIEQAYIQGRAIDMTDAHRALYEKYRQKVERQIGQ